MKILEFKQLSFQNSGKIFFIRIDPEDLTKTLNDVLRSLMDLSWISKFDEEYEKAAFQSRANKTITDIKDKFSKCSDDNITKDAGEYVVSELSRKAIVNQLNYLDIPIGELLGKKKSGNPGFDFHSQNSTTDTIIFGEAKYNSRTTAYSSAIPQIKDFVIHKKDIEDLPELKPFCTKKALRRANSGNKGFAAAFSARSTKSESIISSITAMEEFSFLSKFDELILVAVNL